MSVMHDQPSVIQRFPRWMATLVIVIMIGCAPTTPKPATPAKKKVSADSVPITNTDPCAMRLHDISGAFLFYYAIYQRLPTTLAELNDAPGVEPLSDMICPVSGRPYIYMPNGMLLPDRNARIILFDPEPSHSGIRWAISIVDPQPGKPLQTRVMAVPESFFVFVTPPAR